MDRMSHRLPVACAPVALRGRLGPGWVVTAAFVGPGTVTTASLAGAQFGYALLWALLAAVLVAIALQEMAARAALATGRPLAALVREAVPRRARPLAVALVVGGIGLGNAAFQAGNLAGASLGLAALWPAPVPLWAVVVADAAFLLLWFGRPRVLEAALQAMVALMLAAFLATLALVPVDWGAALAGMLVPSLPVGAAALAVGLVGTTVVPYNLFLHASLARRHGWGAGDVGPMRRDTAVAIAAGGALSMAIVLTSAAALPGARIAGAGDMAAQLGPLLGPLAAGAFALGLFAAGMTSAITAPLAAAYALTHALGWPAAADEERGGRFRAVWAAVLLAGLAPVLLGVEAVPLIVAAQALNGLLLPLMAALLLAAANDPRLGPLRNGRAANLAGAAAVGVALLLGANLLARALLGPG